ncbi:hypothetical protein [Pseudomonas corrugata]|uniref:hypothetical protein n=1 Tax=Pseudomonas corrugata TaxID=47879 RepID=UPI000AA53647|nr:hypothetical protein [Pseudomonas corrugata]
MTLKRNPAPQAVALNAIAAKVIYTQSRQYPSAITRARLAFFTQRREGVHSLLTQFACTENTAFKRSHRNASTGLR